MKFIPVPKYLNWPHSQSIQQEYQCEFDVLITSGCSFTSSTSWFEGPASWPGYVRDRCGIPLCIDMSFPGAGNLWISDSIKHAIENLCQNYQPKNILVIVMWSGIDRVEVVKNFSKDLKVDNFPVIGNRMYQRVERLTCQLDSVQISKDHILDLKSYLEHYEINWIFTSYANLLFPPFIPKRDTTKHFQDFLIKKDIDKLQSISWIPSNGMDFLFEWAWKNNFLNDGDYFHPPMDANFRWTDEILLPHIASRNLIKPLFD